MSARRARSRSLGRGLVGASLIAGLALVPIAAPFVSPQDSGAFGPGVAHADPVPTPSVRPTPTATPSSSATTPASESEGGECSQNSPSYIKQTPAIFDAVGVRRAWEISRGRGVTVAIIDSGVAAGNQHFQGSDGPVVLPGIDLSGENTDGRVDVGEHGTAIAGAIAAQELPKEMGSGLVGVAPEVKILPVRVETGLQENRPQKEGEETFMSKVGRGIQWASDQGAQIIVVAQSAPVGDPQLEEAINAVRGRALVVASTGNVYQGQETDKVVYPAAYPGVLGVTASNADGSASDQQVHGAHVKLAVPAGVILTTWFDQVDCLVGGYEGDQPLPSSSYATAYAAGFAALVASAYPDEGPDMWKYRLEVTALRGTADQRTDALGWGVASPFDALTFTDIGTRYGPEHPNAAEHPAPARPAVASADLTSRDNNLTIRAYIVSAIAVLGASLLGGLVILSHLRGRPAVVEDSEEDLS